MKTILSIKQDNAVRLFYSTDGNIKKVCERLGIKRQIFYRWLKNPEFKKRIDYQIEMIQDNQLGICWHLIQDREITTVKERIKKGKVYKEVTTFYGNPYPNRVVYKAIITLFKIYATRGNRRAIQWCGISVPSEPSEPTKTECKVYRLPRELVRYRIAA